MDRNKLVAAFGAVLVAGAVAGAASANTIILYGTQGDFAGNDGAPAFTTGNAGTGGVTVSTVTTVATPTEGETTNGILASSTSAGQSGTAGSLQISLPNGLASSTLSSNYEVVASTSYQNWGTTSGNGASATLTPSALVNALDSGGTLTLDFTVPAGTTYLNPPRFLLNYPGNYDQLSGVASTTADANGFYTDTISLASINNIAAAELAQYQSAGYGYLTFGIILNGEVPTGSTVNIANIEVNTPAATPEPASIGLFGAGAVGLMLLGRKRLAK
jgi:hypothetical protein